MLRVRSLPGWGRSHTSPGHELDRRGPFRSLHSPLPCIVLHIPSGPPGLLVMLFESLRTTDGSSGPISGGQWGWESRLPVASGLHSPPLCASQSSHPPAFLRLLPLAVVDGLGRARDVGLTEKGPAGPKALSGQRVGSPSGPGALGLVSPQPDHRSPAHLCPCTVCGLLEASLSCPRPDLWVAPALRTWRRGCAGPVPDQHLPRDLRGPGGSGFPSCTSRLLGSSGMSRREGRGAGAARKEVRRTRTPSRATDYHHPTPAPPRPRLAHCPHGAVWGERPALQAPGPWALVGSVLFGVLPLKTITKTVSKRGGLR